MGQFEDMNLFVRIVESGSITATADQMNVAKSAVSRRLMELESRLGVQLINRTTRKSSLTEAGQVYYRHALNILANTEDLNNLVGQGSAELQGTLKISLPVSFGLLHLTPVINKFASLHPGLLIDLHFADRQINLIEEGFDMAVRIADLADSSLIAKRITTIRHTLAASPDYLLKHGVPKTPEDLRDHDILKYSSPTGLAHVLKDSLGNPHEIQGNIVTISNNGDFLKQSAVAGRGIYHTPTFICWQEFRTGTLVPILTEYEQTELGAYIVYPQTRFLSQRVRQFIDFVSDQFGPHPYWDVIDQ